MTARSPMRTKDRATAVGFCSGCGFIREDYEGVPVTDCRCTALMGHMLFCNYVTAVSMMISIGIGCDLHGLEACEECDCNCGTVDKGDG